MENENIKLIKPIKAYELEIFDFKKEMLKNNDVLHGASYLENYDSFEEWEKVFDSYKDRNNLSGDFVEGSQWLLVDLSKKRLLGMFNIRHYLNKDLLSTGGHVGYSIRPNEREKGYAKLGLIEAVKFLNSMGEADVLVTCDLDNLASKRVIIACGGVLENIVYSDKYKCEVERYWIRKKD